MVLNTLAVPIKMPNGDTHSGKTHGKTSKKLFHFGDLSTTAKKKVRSKK